jgi:hypothetical protein
MVSPPLVQCQRPSAKSGGNLMYVQLHETQRSRSGSRWRIAEHTVGWPGRAGRSLDYGGRALGGEIMTGAPVESIDEFAPVRFILLDSARYCGWPTTGFKPHHHRARIRAVHVPPPTSSPGPSRKSPSARRPRRSRHLRRGDLIPTARTTAIWRFPLPRFAFALWLPLPPPATGDRRCRLQGHTPSGPLPDLQGHQSRHPLRGLIGPLL